MKKIKTVHTKLHVTIFQNVERSVSQRHRMKKEVPIYDCRNDINNLEHITGTGEYIVLKSLQGVFHSN